jgi:tRNA threonylcarbamoyladenosine biosynthesis protein TsaE
MSIEQTLRIESTSLDETLQLAADIGARLRGGEVIELVSDLGGGKTAFTRGLAQGMGSTDTVSSPSFTISNEYQAGKLRLCHFDFYRLHEAGIMSDEIKELIDDPQVVVVVEWAGVVENVLPAQRVRIEIETTGENSRTFLCSYPDTLSYLFGDNT